MSNHGNGVEAENNGNNDLDLQWAKEVINKFYVQLQRAFKIVMVDFHGYEVLNEVTQWSFRNPTVFCCILALVLIVMLPALILVGMGISTLLMTFTGFLVLEGTLFTGLAILMFSCLGGLALLLLCFITFGAAVYYGLARMFDLFGCSGHSKQNSENLKNLVSKKKKHENKENNFKTNTNSYLDSSTTN